MKDVENFNKVVLNKRGKLNSRALNWEYVKKKQVVIKGVYGINQSIDVPDTSDFRVGDSVEYGYKCVKIVEVKHDLDEMVTYYICE